MFYVGVIFISLVGALLHFVYEFSGHNKIVAVFAAVNESTWEHIKICMTATLIWSLYDGFVYGIDTNYLIGKSMCLLTIILVIPILFYTYTFFTKRSILIIDIICFVITVYLSQLVFYHYINASFLPFIYTYLAAILLFAEMSAYLTLTYMPFKNFIFRDPISHKYGLEGHTEMHHHDHKKHKELVILLLVLLLLSGCFKTKKELTRLFEVDVSKCEFEDEKEHREGFNGDGEYVAILNCSKMNNEELTTKWKKLPVSDEINEVMQMIRCDEDKCLNAIERYNIPLDGNGYYFFYDRHSDAVDKHSSIPLNDRASYNFSLAIFNVENKKIYLYELDT